MPRIEINTKIRANIDICFDLARSIDLHTISTIDTNEKAIGGRTSGLIELGETVTWEAKHFGIIQKLTSEITKFDKPFHFRDIQLNGAFKSFHHDHYFEGKNGVVLMKDVFEYQSPFGFIGRIFNNVILTRYLTDFLKKRNGMIKEYAESTKWKSVLNDLAPQT